MPLILRPKTTKEIHGDWPTINRKVMIRSRVHSILREEMLQHLQGAISGRSFLIAGHRGAGKTMLVQSVVDEIRRTILSEASTKDGEYVRPLLVKLHGPSLLGGGVSPKPETTIDRLVRVAVDGEGETQSEDGHGNSDDATPSAEGADEALGAALAQIMVALYRALTSEMSQAVLLGARGTDKSDDRRRGDADELAATLKLALDAGADPAVLRECWSRLDVSGEPSRQREFPAQTLYLEEDKFQPRSLPGRGCLESGVLWPFACSRKYLGRGYQEIVALTTAAQSFQVCIGTVTASETRSGATAREAKLELKAGAGLRDLTNKIFGLAAGLGVGLGVNAASMPLAATAAGLATALATSLTLDWSTSRSSKSETNSSYTFLPNRDLQSLDRDLPVVIERIRAVGLAPIFIVDELDKIECPDVPLSSLIKRLKQLTSDFAFFCFLTDRAYLDGLEARFRAGVYPLEHTYFAHRLLVAYRPEDYAAYLRDSIAATSVISSSSSRSGVAPEQVAALILGRVLMHRSGLNSAALVRELADVTGEGQTITIDEAQLRSLEIHRLETMLQLAIEFAMRQPSILARTRSNERFVQVAADALYMISRKWRAGERSVTITTESVKAHLAHRMNISADELQDRLSATDLDAFLAGVRRVAEAMCDFETLYRTLSQDVGFAEADRPLLEVFRPELRPGLLRHGGDDEYVFRWDAQGILLGLALAAGDEASAFVRGFLALCFDVGLSLDLLVTAGLLPSTISDVATQAAQSRYQAAPDYPERQSDITRLKTVHQELVNRGPLLKVVLFLARCIGSLAGCSGSVAFEAIRRYAPLEDIVSRSGDEFLFAIQGILGGTVPLQPAELSVDPSPDIADWRTQIMEARIPLRKQRTSAESWSVWLARLNHFVNNEKSNVVASSLDDVISAARGDFPERLFQWDLSSLGITQWSELVLEGALFGDTPAWVVPVGLYKLGFGRDLLQRMSVEAPLLELGSREAALAGMANELAGRAPQGILDIVSNPTNEASRGDFGDRPVLRMLFAQAEKYGMAVHWLTSCDAFAFIAYDGYDDDGPIS